MIISSSVQSNQVLWKDQVLNGQPILLDLAETEDYYLSTSFEEIRRERGDSPLFIAALVDECGCVVFCEAIQHLLHSVNHSEKRHPITRRPLAGRHFYQVGEKQSQENSAAQ